MSVNQKKLFKDKTCDLCGGAFAGEFRLRQHRQMCENIPPEVRTQGPQAIEAFGSAQRQFKARLMARERGAIGNVVCHLEGCGYAAKAPQGLAKHQYSCNTRSPQERTAILSTLEKYRNYGDKYGHMKKLEAARNGKAVHRMANGARWVEPEPKPVLQELGRTELSISLDNDALADFLRESLPKLLSLVKSVKLERG